MQEPDAATRTPAKDLAELHAAGDRVALVRAAAALHPAELGEVLAAGDSDLQALLLDVLPGHIVGAALAYIEPHYRSALLIDLAPARIAEVLRAVADDIATDVIQELPADIANAALTAMPVALQRQVGRLIEYGPETAGGRMTGQRIAVAPERTVREVIEFLRSLRPDTEQPFDVYLTDSANRLRGVLNLRLLITAPPDTPVGELATMDAVSITADTDQEEAARLLKRYNLLALPVVDGAGRLLGTVTVDDLLDVLEDEATEDMYRMAGINVDEDLRGVGRSVRHRLPWLVVNLGSATLAAAVVSLFEDTITRLALVAAFMPIVAGMGGNAGIQTVTIVVRSLTLGRITPRDAWGVMRHELAVGLIIGTAIGVPIGIIGWSVQGSPALGLIVGAAMCANIANGMVTGVAVPLLLHRAGQDPTISAGIWMTTFTDIIGFLLLLGLATLFLDTLL